MNGLKEFAGYEAWRKMVKWYELKVEDRVMQMKIELMGMGRKKAKDVRELKRMLLLFGVVWCSRYEMIMYFWSNDITIRMISWFKVCVPLK